MTGTEHQPSTLLRLLLLLTSFVFGLALLETAFHAWAPQPLYAVRFAPWGFAHIPNVSFTHAAEAWYEHRWLAGRDFVTRVQYNSHGLRDYDYGYAKPPHAARILVLGDSYGEGMEVQLFQTASKVLESKLNEWLRAGNRLEGPVASQRGKRLADMPPVAADDSPDWDVTQLNFREMRRTADTIDAGLLVANVQYSGVDGQTEDLLRQRPITELLGQAARLPWNERRSFFDGIGIDSLNVRDSGVAGLHYRYDGHWTPAGHARAANSIFEKIIGSRLLPLGPETDQVQVINASMSAYSTCKELMLLQSEGVKYHPDLVLVLYTAADERNVNDVAMCNPDSNGHLEINPQTFTPRQQLSRNLVGFIKSHSHFLTFVYDRVHRVFGYAAAVQFASEAHETPTPSTDPIGAAQRRIFAPGTSGMPAPTVTATQGGIRSPARVPLPTSPEPELHRLSIGTPSKLDQLDPHRVADVATMNILQNVYSGLVRAGTDLLPQPDLATSWRYEDPRTLRFVLRKGAKFQDGRLVTAADVKYSFERITDPKTRSPYAGLLAVIESIDPPQSDVVVFHLKQPDASLINRLTLPAMAIIPQGAAEQPAGTVQNIVGSGPFVVNGLVPGSWLVLTKNPDYFVPDQPRLDELDYLSIPDAASRTAALVDGMIDFEDALPATEVQSIERRSVLIVRSSPTPGFLSLTLNTTKKPLNDVRVRRALAYAVDRDELVRKVFDGRAQPLWGSPFDSTFWAGDSRPYYSFDPDKARQLLADAGYGSGVQLQMMIDNAPYQHALADDLVPQLHAVGIELMLTRVDTTEAIERWLGGDYETYPLRLQAEDLMDPAQSLEVLNTRIGVMSRDQIGRLLSQDQPWLFLASANEYQAMRAGVKDFTPFPNGSQYSLREVSLSL